MRFFVLFAFYLCLSVHSFADDFQYGQYDDALAWTHYEKDPAASAVVVKEFGKLFRDGFGNNPITLYIHVRKKIFSKDGFDAGNIHIPLRMIDNDRFESITALKGITYIRHPDGNIETIELDPQKIIRENKKKDLDYIKFAMPGLKEGCVIEYSYILSSPYSYTPPVWYFQSDIPKVESELITIFPGNFGYNGLLIGPYKLASAKSHVEENCIVMGSMQNNCLISDYIMKDIPAFTEEAMMPAERNYRAAIRLELAEYYDLNGNKHETSTEWKHLEKLLKESDYFGKQLSRKGLFKDVVPDIITNKIGEKEKAKAVYTYYQKWFKWNGDDDFGSNDISKALKSHTGSVADINLSLVTALNVAGMYATPVLLSTKEHGTLNGLFPSLRDFDYVVARVAIGKDSFLLDATDPSLSFGIIPSRCFNGQGRVMAEKGSYWIDLLPIYKQVSQFNINLVLQPDGKLKGTIACSYSGYEGYDKRQAIKKYSTTEEYLESVTADWHSIKVLTAKIENTEEPEKILEEKYEIEITAFDTAAPSLLFNPFIINKIKENPFKLEKRLYPVAFDVASEKRIVLTCTFPAGFALQEKPQDVALSLPNKGGKFLSEVYVDGNSFMISQLLQLDKTIYDVVEYPYLKEFYNKLIQHQKTGMVFKKI